MLSNNWSLGISARLATALVLLAAAGVVFYVAPANADPQDVSLSDSLARESEASSAFEELTYGQNAEHEELSICDRWFSQYLEIGGKKAGDTPGLYWRDSVERCQEFLIAGAACEPRFSKLSGNSISSHPLMATLSEKSSLVGMCASSPRVAPSVLAELAVFTPSSDTNTEVASWMPPPTPIRPAHELFTEHRREGNATWGLYAASRGDRFGSIWAELFAPNALLTLRMEVRGDPQAAEDDRVAFLQLIDDVWKNWRRFNDTFVFDVLTPP